MGHGADLVGTIPSSVEVRQQSYVEQYKQETACQSFPGPCRDSRQGRPALDICWSQGASSDCFCFARFKNVKLGRRVGNAFTAGVYFGTGDGLASLKMSWHLTEKMHY